MYDQMTHQNLMQLAKLKKGSLAREQTNTMPTTHLYLGHSFLSMSAALWNRPALSISRAWGPYRASSAKQPTATRLQAIRESLYPALEK
jgi:hypothetical protein